MRYEQFIGEAADLAAQLPGEIASYLQGGKSESIGLKEFFERVGKREGITAAEAEQHARAVLSVLSEAVTQGEIEDICSQLPVEYLALFGRGEKETIH